uniref:Saposin B-type domain-containing protein n=1 Tax=Strongyloides papillosus TaxID=174720 RepID=A0A0N5C495_STREA
MKLSITTTSILFVLLFNYTNQHKLSPKNLISSSCANCLLLAKVLSLKDHIKLPIKNNFCTTSKICFNDNVSDCKILEALENNNDIVHSKLKSTEVLKKYLENSKETCRTNTNFEIFSFNSLNSNTNSTTPSYGLCVECELLSTILKIFNDAIFGGPIETAVRNAFMKVCMQFGAFIDSFCEFLFSDNGIDLLFQALRDSLGSMYQIAGVQGMGCPKFSDLESTCFTPQ